MTEEEKSYYPDFPDRKFFFVSNQFKISRDDKIIASICEGSNEDDDQSNILIEFSKVDNKITPLMKVTLPK